MNKIIDKIDEIEFHDLPVENLQFVFDPPLSLVLTVFQYDDDLGLYRRYAIRFKEISTIDLPNLELNFGMQVSVDINNFNYSFENIFTCDIELVFGHSHPSWNLVFDCKSIEVAELESSTDGLG